MKTWFETAKSIVTSPNTFFKKMKTKGGYGDPISFAAINFLIAGVLGGLLTFNIFFALGMAIASVLIGILSLFVISAVFHLIVLMFRGKGKYEATFRVVAYASVVMLVSWIPFVGFFAALYLFYLYMVGFSHVHKMSKGKALLVAVLPSLVLWVLAAIVLSLAAVSLFGGLAGYGLAQSI